MKKLIQLLTLTLALVLILSLTACGGKRVKALAEALDANGFSTLLSESDFFALADTFTHDGSMMSELMIYDFDTSNGKGKTNSDDTLTMKYETIAEEDSRYVKTYQYFMTAKALEGFTLPQNLVFGDSLATALDKLVGDKDAAEDFTPSGEYDYEMILKEKDNAKIVYRDMTKDEEVTGYRFIYQIRYIDEYRTMTDLGSVLTKRTLVLSFDNTAEGHPLTLIEVSMESRYQG